MSEKQEATLGENVYSILKTNIVELMIKPGETISIKEICEQLGVGRSPVRDALIKLEKEGLIKSMPQKGTMIAKINMDRVAEEQYLRECLEEKTMGLFLKIHEKSDLIKLRQILEKQKTCVAGVDSRRFLRYDEDFHQIFFDVTAKPLCWQAIQNTSGHYGRIRLLSLQEEETLNNVISEHEKIIQGIEENQSKMVCELIHEHVSKLKTKGLDIVQKYPELFENVKVRAEHPVGFLNQDFLQQLRK